MTSSAASDHGPDWLHVWVNDMCPTVSQLQLGLMQPWQSTGDGVGDGAAEVAAAAAAAAITASDICTRSVVIISDIPVHRGPQRLHMYMYRRRYVPFCSGPCAGYLDCMSWCRLTLRNLNLRVLDEFEPNDRGACW